MQKHFFIQLITELFPISSSGHLSLAQLIFKTSSLPFVIELLSYWFSSYIIIIGSISLIKNNTFLYNFFFSFKTYFLLSSAVLASGGSLYIMRKYFFLLSPLPLYDGFFLTVLLLLFSLFFNYWYPSRKEKITLDYYYLFLISIIQVIVGFIPGLSRLATVFVVGYCYGYNKKVSALLSFITGALLGLYANIFYIFTHYEIVNEIYLFLFSLSLLDIFCLLLYFFCGSFLYFFSFYLLTTQKIYYLILYEFVIAIIALLYYI